MTRQKPEKRGRGRPRKHDPPPEPAKTTASIGNCLVEFPASLPSSSDAEGLCINVSETSTVCIKVPKESLIELAGFSFILLNPKSLDGVGKQLLQDVLQLYTRELPAMKYAANTGKESQFLENCIFGGKYCTLILRNAELELLGAITYQMLPTDTYQAELPLAAVAQAHHRKGFGACLYKELQRRLFDVGVLSIFCWGDHESEAFWAKQGFVTVAEVDGSGKSWKLPIKADVRRAMSIPGSATLMISYLTFPSIQPAFPEPPASAITSHKTPSGEISGKTSSEICKTVLENSPLRRKPLPPIGEKAGQKSSPTSIPTPQVGGESKSSFVITVTPGQAFGESAVREKSVCASMTPFNMEGMFSTVASQDPKGNASKPLEPPLLIEIIRPPLADTTNAGLPSNAVNRPLKKRPITKSTPEKSNVPTEERTTTLDGEKENVAEKELRGRSPNHLKMLMSTPTRTIGRRRRGEPETEGSKEAQIEVDLDRENEVKEAFKSGIDYESIPAVFPEKSGDKRCREFEVQTSVFARRSTRRRMADSAEGTEDQTKKETEKSNSAQLNYGAKHMFDLLLPPQATASGGCSEADAEKSVPRDCQEPYKGMKGTTSIANSGDHPMSQTDVERQNAFVTEGDPTGRSAGAPGHHESNHIKSGGSRGPHKLPPEVVNSCGATEQPLNKTSPIIMFMNMSDENKKKQLTKHVETLSGTVTSDGCKCTHVVTGEVRRTLNFCVAISSGAWILSPEWLKTSVKQKRFADEARFVLRDRKFESKYKVKLQYVIRRAKERPNLLLDGQYIYLTPHIHPPVDTITQIVEAAGGKVLGSLQEALQLEDKSHAAAVATEEDMSEAISAAKAGLRTFSSDWLLTCIVKQELDLTATQFSESL